MLQIVLRNKKGVTLVEVMISLVILLVVFMGLIQASLITIENTMMTALRDEAVRLASDTVSALRTGSFDDVNRDKSPTPDPAHTYFKINSSGSAAEKLNATNFHINTVITSRNLTSNYVITVTIDSLDSENKQATVEVNWDWKERTYVGGNPNSHKVVALLRRA